MTDRWTSGRSQSVHGNETRGWTNELGGMVGLDLKISCWASQSCSDQSCCCFTLRGDLWSIWPRCYLEISLGEGGVVQPPTDLTWHVGGVVFHIWFRTREELKEMRGWSLGRPTFSVAPLTPTQVTPTKTTQKLGYWYLQPISKADCNVTNCLIIRTHSSALVRTKNCWRMSMCLYYKIPPFLIK